MLSISHLTFAYEQGPALLKDLSMEIHDGDYVAIVGENGSGKSTLVKLILGLLTPSRGTIRNTFKRPAYVPQPTDMVNKQFPITVYEVLDYTRQVLHIKDKAATARALERMHITNLKDHLIGALSGGQYQKVMIAKALLGQPDIMIFDEPSTGMDLKSQDDLYPLIHQLNEEQGITIITVEHNLRYAAHQATTFFHVVRGQGHFCSPHEYIQEYLAENGGDCAHV